MRISTSTFAFLFPIILAVPVAVSAQDSDMIEVTPTVPTAAESFAAADLDQSGTLNGDEFVSYAVMRADAGDEDFKVTVSSGDYDGAFTAKDADADNEISAAEAGAEAATDSDVDMEDGDTPEPM
ncbi:hypothetical protein ACJ3XI_02450 [Litorimonas sp. RW-G-Af-16]|uniref:hypothetical protein n=1 Tax=Litorimonas sp. RW-G-Af-16 TaxID=3241168 RepID=UPI00390CA989